MPDIKKKSTRPDRADKPLPEDSDIGREMPVHEDKLVEAVAIIPPFWKGPGHDISVGDCCKQDGHTVIVSQIYNCINGTVVLGVVKLSDNKLHNIIINKPEVHKLASYPRDTPEQDAKVQALWEYECQ